MKTSVSMTLCGVLAAVSFCAGAQAPFPARPVHIVVPYPPGGIDAVPRVIADKMRQTWGQTVIMDNRPGAGGLIAAEYVSKAPPDGYTLLLGVPDSLVILPLISKNVRFDVTRDFAPVTVMFQFPLVFVAKSNLPATNIREMVAMAKANPTKLSLATWGEGSTGHLGLELFKSMAGVDILHVPYKGSPQAMTALVAGEVDMMIAGFNNAGPHIKSGRIRILARTSLARSPELPDIPTVAEVYPGYSVATWVGLVAPARTPRAVIETIQRTVGRSLVLPDVHERIVSLYAETVASTPDEFQKMLAEEQAKWRGVARSAKIQLD